MKNISSNLHTNFQLLSKTLVLFACLGLASCSNNLTTIGATMASQVPSESTPEAIDMPEPTPLPNPRAEVILTYNFNGFIKHIQGHDLTISQDELELLQQERTPFLVDLRKPLEVKKTGFISGAISIPIVELGRKTSALPDFSVPIIVYCQRTTECMIALTGLGVYGWDIRVLAGGFEAWAAAGKFISHDPIPVPKIDPYKPAFPCCGIFEESAEVPTNPNAPSASLVAATDRMFDHIPENFGAITQEEFDQKISTDPSLVVIDLRTAATLIENKTIIATNSLNIPFDQLVEERDSWPKDKSTPIVVYCQDGTVSPIAMTIFWSWGYLNTRELQGGLNSWKN